MQSPCLREATEVCLHGCCPSPLLKMAEHEKPTPKSKSTSAACRHNFTEKTSSSFFPNTHFTNHESLPSLQESFTQFSNAYPKYMETTRADQIRANEYYHLSLSNHVCLDYIGVGLFSHSQLQSQYSSKIPIASSSSPTPQYSDFPFFSISYKSVGLKSQLLHGCEASELESAIKRRIMNFLNISETDYCMVFTANKSSAFKLLAESYPFQSNRKLLSVYDYQSEAVDAMIKTLEKRGAKVMSAEFKWPTLRINSIELKKMLVSKTKKKKNRGLFVFPLQSRMTGANYSYQWMSMAQENGWHVLFDACALGPKDMDSFGLSLFHPDFIVCSFYKVFGENPTGFGCLFVKRTTVPMLEDSAGTGIVNLIPPKNIFRLYEDSSGTDTELESMSTLGTQEDRLTTGSSPTGSFIFQVMQHGNFGREGSPEAVKTEVIKEQKETVQSSKQLKAEKHPDFTHKKNNEINGNEKSGIVCRGLDHVDAFGLTMISSRARCLINWLVISLMKLQHPNNENRIPLVRIYGPKVKFDRGPALAFNVYDWKGELVEPILVQKLADRSNISLGCGFLHHIWFSDKYEQDKDIVMEKRKFEEKEMTRNKRRIADQGITVVTAALGFLANFEDTYKLWTFVARFLDADFVEKERWRYTALNQKTVEVL